MMRWWWLAGGSAVLLLTSALLARQGVIHTTDGRTFEGDVTETTGDNGQPVVSVTVFGGTVSFPRADVTSIQYAADSEQEYRDMLSKLGPADVDGRLDLARRELEQRHYTQAREATNSALHLDPHNATALTLLDTIQSQEILDSRPPATAPSPSAAREAAATAPSGSAAPAGTPLHGELAETPPPAGRYLSDAQINRIRQVELRAQDNVRVTFLNDVRRRYVLASGADPAVFDNATPAQQALAILTNAPQMSGDVRIDSDPAALLVFHNRVEPEVLAGCATSGCHGGATNGGFFLYPDVEQSAAWYTNFYILMTYSKRFEETNVFGRGAVMRPMVDRVRPASSLLAQFSLPPKLATDPHPQVAHWKPLFATNYDRGYVEMLDWIGTVLKPFEPAYGFTFAVPGRNASTQPSNPTP